MDRAAKFKGKQALLALAMALSIALMVNWAILQFFGQKSAYRAEHSLVGILLLMGYIALWADQHASPFRSVGFFCLALVPCYLGTVFPDLDIMILGIGGHRNPLFHSSLSLFLLWLCLRRGLRQSRAILDTLVSGYGIGLASHLGWDVLYYGDVRWLPGSLIDRLWLGVHGILCLTAAGTGVLRSHRSGV